MPPDSGGVCGWLEAWEIGAESVSSCLSLDFDLAEEALSFIGTTLALLVLHLLLPL